MTHIFRYDSCVLDASDCWKDLFVFFTQRKFSTLLLPIGYWLNVESSHCNTRAPPLVLVIKGLWKITFCPFEFDQKCACNMASYKCYMTGYTDLPVIVIIPKITVMKPGKIFQTLRHSKVKKSCH